ncbi:hypothetical protein [Vibrio owensii]|uniref:Tat pathway signal protein n=2 Tax=Vibrio harveyi group TaxID=717610 RepID=A0A0C1ZHU3_9VIBR|nr:hypothetical protein [Vibrio owensii]KIF52731.1 Tat pathway signal protein [Vibrio owensii CAIM 1854 = LMG 25443]
MKIKRRDFLKSGLTGASGLLMSSTLPALPIFSLTEEKGVMTISFSGTSCTRDEGEVSREESDKNIYLPSTGYIPVRIINELKTVGVTIRGAGENDWAHTRETSEPLMVNGPLNVPDELLSDISGYTTGNQFRKYKEPFLGWSMPALALHGANLSAASKASVFNFIGHSRGACEAIMAAWFLYAYGDEEMRNTPINIFAIDPVPGPGTWWSILTQLPPNVVNYVGIYSWDQSYNLNIQDHAFQALVPRPNGRMRGESNEIATNSQSWWSWIQRYPSWASMADSVQQADPLAPDNNRPQPIGYDLYACRGRHSTVAGNTTSDGYYNADKVSSSVAPVPELIYKIARGYLTKWGATFAVPCAVEQSVFELRKEIHTFHRDFDIMGGGETRNSNTLSGRPYVRRISSIWGRNPNDTYYMDDVVGDPPYKLVYPVTKDRRNKGWVDWKFL